VKVLKGYSSLREGFTGADIGPGIAGNLRSVIESREPHEQQWSKVKRPEVKPSRYVSAQACVTLFL
jgi:hypothetical protein